MIDKPDLSAQQLKEKLQVEFGIHVSVSRVNTYRRSLGWTIRGTRYCQMIRDANKVKRKDWCEEQLRTNENFDVSKSSQILKHFFYIPFYLMRTS